MCIPLESLKLSAPLGVDILRGANDFTSQESAFQRNKLAAITEATANQRLLHQQNQQFIDAQGDELAERTKEARIAKARLRLASSESGVGGVSVNRLINAEDAAASQDLSVIGRNVSNRLKQSDAELKGINATAANRINSIARPSLLGIGLQVASKESARRTGARPKSTTTTTKSTHRSKVAKINARSAKTRNTQAEKVERDVQLAMEGKLSDFIENTPAKERTKVKPKKKK